MKLLLETWCLNCTLCFAAARPCPAEKAYPVQLNRSLSLGSHLSLPASPSYDGSPHVHGTKVHTNLVPYPRIRNSFATARCSSRRRRLTTDSFSVIEITLSVRHPASMMFKRVLRHGTYMACGLLFHGDVVPKVVDAAVAVVNTRHTIQFRCWSQTGFRQMITVTLRISLLFKDSATSLLDLSEARLPALTASKAWSRAQVYLEDEAPFETFFLMPGFGQRCLRVRWSPRKRSSTLATGSCLPRSSCLVVSATPQVCGGPISARTSSPCWANSLDVWIGNVNTNLRDSLKRIQELPRDNAFNVRRAHQARGDPGRYRRRAHQLPSWSTFHQRQQFT